MSDNCLILIHDSPACADESRRRALLGAATHMSDRYSLVIAITDAPSRAAHHSQLRSLRGRSRRRVDLNTLRDNGDHRATAADRIALYLAEMRNGILSAEIAHDRHSALEVLGGALSLVPGLVDEAGPINVEAELRAVVALTRNHWAQRVNVVVDAPARTAQFWGRWWVARLAAMRMLMLGAEGHRRVPNNFNHNRLPSVRLTGRLLGARFELRTVVDAATPLAAEPDSVLLLCAKCLDGEIMTAYPNNGGVLLSFQFPIRLAGAVPEQRAG